MADDLTDDTMPTPRTPVNPRQTPEGGAREYPEPEKRRGFPLWLIPLALIPLLLLLFRPRDNNETVPVTTTATPSSYAVSATPGATTATTYPVGSATDGSFAGTASPAPVLSGIDTSTADSASTMDDTDTAASAAQPPVQGKDMKVYKGKDIAVAPLQGASAQGEPLTDVVTFAQVADKSALIDRKVKLHNVNIVRTINDRVFEVGPSNDQHMLVMLDPKMRATSKKPMVLREGEKVSLVGILKELPASSEMESQYSLRESDYGHLQQDGVYLHATITQEK